MMSRTRPVPFASCLAGVVALTLVGTLAAEREGAAQTAPQAPVSEPLCKPDPANRAGPSLCPPSAGGARVSAGGGAGGGGSGGGGGAGGGGSGNSSAAESLGPYRIVKIMNLGGETIDGSVCSIDQPFVVHMHTRNIDFDIKFMPADKAHGTWTYAYSIPRAGETHAASGDHTITVPGADGMRTLAIDGTDFVQFKGFAGPMPMRYSMGLAPAASCN